MATQTTNYGLTKPAWDEMVDVSVLNGNSDIIDAQMKANQTAAGNAVANMADAYDATATYSVGDYVTYNGQLYICSTAVSIAEAFDNTKWTATTAAEHFSDGGGGGGGTLIQPVIYSDTEREIGVWRDGKPLYQKTIDLGANISISNSSPTDLNVSVDDLERIIDGMAVTSSADYCCPIMVVFDLSNDTTIKAQACRQSGGISCRFITIWYTKTTDTPGSGTWTPSGVPAVHYSTTEHVVGTWIDGSALYEKTYEFQNVSVQRNSSIVLTTITGIFAVYMDGFFIENGNHFAVPEKSVRIYVESNGDLTLTTSDASFDGALYVTLRYTKTTS